MLQATEQRLLLLYELLNVSRTASEREIRAAYEHLKRIWHITAAPNWSRMGITTAAKESDNFLIFTAIRLAHNFLTNEELKKAYLKGKIDAIPSLQNLIEYKHRVEQQFSDFLKSRPKKESNTALIAFNTALPEELLLRIARKLDNPSLAKLARFSSLSHIAREVLWQRLIATQDKYILRDHFSERFKFIPPTLAVTFSPECNEHQGELRLLPYSDMNIPLSPLEVMYKTTVRVRGDFGTTASYFAYLIGNSQALHTATLNVPGLYDLQDENKKTFRQTLTEKMSVLHVLTTLPYRQIIAGYIRYIVASGTTLPAPFKERSDFSTTAHYFEYLILNPHDLLVALLNNPALINEQDENKQTLLFYPVIAARFLSKRSVQWVMDILTATPNIDLSLKDINGDSCVHWTTQNCLHDFENKEGIASTGTRLIFEEVFIPLLTFAKRKNFNFDSMNGTGMSILQVAANLSQEEPNAVFSVLVTLDEAPKSVYDPNLLSGEKHTALYYAVDHLHLEQIKRLLEKTHFEGPSAQEVVLLLQRKIFNKCKLLMEKLDQLPRKNYSDIGEKDKAVSALSAEFSLLRELYNVFVKMTAKYKNSQVLESVGYKRSRSHWLNPDMVDKIVSRAQNLSWYSSVSFNLASREAVAKVLGCLNDRTPYRDPMYFKSDGLWSFILSVGSEKTALLNIILEVFKEELDQLIVDIHSALPREQINLVGEDVHVVFKEDQAKESLPIANAEDEVNILKRLLSVKLLELKATSSGAITRELADYFNNLTKDKSIEICNTLFEFLLGHKEDVIKTSSLWQESVKRHINWPLLINAIRSNALKNIKELNDIMSHGQAVVFLEKCRNLPIINLPNGTFEYYRGRTHAVDELDQLKVQRQKQKDLQPTIGSPKNSK